MYTCLALTWYKISCQLPWTCAWLFDACTQKCTHKLACAHVRSHKCTATIFQCDANAASPLKHIHSQETTHSNAYIVQQRRLSFGLWTQHLFSSSLSQHSPTDRQIVLIIRFFSLFSCAMTHFRVTEPTYGLTHTLQKGRPWIRLQWVKSSLFTVWSWNLILLPRSLTPQFCLICAEWCVFICAPIFILHCTSVREQQWRVCWWEKNPVLWDELRQHLESCFSCVLPWADLSPQRGELSFFKWQNLKTHIHTAAAASLLPLLLSHLPLSAVLLENRKMAWVAIGFSHLITARHKLESRFLLE